MPHFETWIGRQSNCVFLTAYLSHCGFGVAFRSFSCVLCDPIYITWYLFLQPLSGIFKKISNNHLFPFELWTVSQLNNASKLSCCISRKYLFRIVTAETSWGGFQMHGPSKVLKKFFLPASEHTEILDLAIWGFKSLTQLTFLFWGILVCVTMYETWLSLVWSNAQRFLR